MIPRKLAWLTFAAWPAPAYAHSPVPGIEGFFTGLLHPFSTPAQALLMLGLGLLIGGFDNRLVRWPFAVFVSATLLGILVGVGIGWIDALMFATAFVACALAALSPGRFLVVSVAVVAAGGFWIGLMSLPDPGPLRDRIITTLGSFMGASLGLLYIFYVLTFVRESNWNWVPIAFRVAAAWIGAITVLMLALLFAPGESIVPTD